MARGARHQAPFLVKRFGRRNDAPEIDDGVRFVTTVAYAWTVDEAVRLAQVARGPCWVEGRGKVHAHMSHKQREARAWTSGG